MTIARGLQDGGERVEHDRFEPRHPGGVRLNDDDIADAIDDQTGQPVGLGMNEAVIGLVEQLPAQPQCPLDPAREKAPADCPAGVAVEQARGEQAVRVEHRHTERAAVGAAQCNERAGSERPRRLVHPHFVRIDPGMAGLGAPVPRRKQSDGRPGRRIVGNRLTGLDRIDFHRALLLPASVRRGHCASGTTDFGEPRSLASWPPSDRPCLFARCWSSCWRRTGVGRLWRKRP